MDVDGQLFVSNRAQVILPYHRMIELASRERARTKKIGTTSRGIGPAYEDKMRAAVCASWTCCDPSCCKTHIENACREKNAIAHALFGTDPLDPAKMYDEYAAAAEQVRPFVTDTGRAAEQGHCATASSVMFEGAQGTMLDIDHGTYPFVTSSSATAGGAVTGTGVGPTAIGTVIGVTKAYVTRVGEGPFPTEIHDAIGDQLRARGQRVRRGDRPSPPLRLAGHCRCCATPTRSTGRVAGGDEDGRAGRTRGDPGLHRLRDRWQGDGRDSRRRVRPGSHQAVYTKLKGWKTSTEGITDFEELPKAAQEYLRFQERESGAKIGMVSTGPDREQTMCFRSLRKHLTNSAHKLDHDARRRQPIPLRAQKKGTPER